MSVVNIWENIDHGPTLYIHCLCTGIISFAVTHLFVVFLQNDAPPTHPTSPGIVPLDLHVSEALVTRGQDGIFRVTTGMCSRS